ncbi:hypothetical protein PENTCL1PPCAC_5474 [Pristionchus entomophagus]|uniref:Glycine N-acyltransferase-like protein n=1 Tax=Pristionchus entomophagus TaxID=358040 RepID=A0AAV5SK50_9BILA|nr:hypothetical protein PENTCL1PPCAC_5474 [Pristionchus entomophagus]
MVLIEWDTEEKQRRLLEILQRDFDGLIVNNHVLDTAIPYSINHRYPFSRLRFFSTECEGDVSPTYVFVFEEMNAFVHARPPTRPHDNTLLQSALVELIEKCVDSEGEMKMKADTHTFEMMELPTIAGFEVGPVDLERDAATIHDNWAWSFSPESTNAYLGYLPASVVRRSSTGEPVSWDMSSPLGEVSNHFTLPDFRGKGLANLAELHLIKSMISEGIRPFKYVGNKIVREASNRSPLWTSWEKDYKQKYDTNEETFFPMNHSSIRKTG